MCLGTSDIAGEANEDAETQQGNTISSEVNFKANRSFSRAGFPDFPSLSFPLGFFLLVNLFLISVGQHIVFKGLDKDILIKFSGESNFQKRTNKINDKIISTIEFNKMTFKKG